MAQQGDEPHPRGHEDSTPAAGERAREEESRHLTALLQPPPFYSQHYCGEEGNKKADCRQGELAVLDRGFLIASSLNGL